MKNLTMRSLILLTIVLMVLNCLHLIQIKVPCMECKRTALIESVLCRFGSGFQTNVMHDFCCPEIKPFFKEDHKDGNNSN